MKVACPSYLGYGGAAKYGQYGYDVIPGNSRLVFELDVLECQPSIEEINEANIKANNNAPMVYRRGQKREATLSKPPAEQKKEVSEIKGTVTKMKKTVRK